MRVRMRRRGRELLVRPRVAAARRPKAACERGRVAHVGGLGGFTLGPSRLDAKGGRCDTCHEERGRSVWPGWKARCEGDARLVEGEVGGDTHAQ